MTFKARLWVAGLAVALSGPGCGEKRAPLSGPDLSGGYEVTHHTLSAGSCDSEGADATGLPFIRLTWELHGGSDYLALRRCQSELETDCDDEDFFHGTSFVIPMDNGWQELKASAALQPVSGDCYLSYSEATLLQNGAGVMLELRRYEEVQPGLDPAECTYERAYAGAGSLPCLDYEVIHGQPPVP